MSGVFFEKYFEGWILHGSLLHSVLKIDNFYKTDISQGSVATCLRCGGTLRNHSIQQICWRVCKWKNSENRFRFDAVTAMSSMSSFFGTRCLLYAYMLHMYLFIYVYTIHIRRALKNIKLVEELINLLLGECTWNWRTAWMYPYKRGTF